MANYVRADEPRIFHIKDVVKDFGGDIERRALNITQRYGMSTGYDELDNLLRGGGLLPGLLYIVAARPGMGKTTLLQNLAINIARQDVPCALFSLEVGRERLLERIAYEEAGIDFMAHYRDKTPLSDAQIEKLQLTLRSLAKLPIYIQDTAGMTPSMVEATLATYHEQCGIKVAFIDYLHIMRVDGRFFGGREREIGSMVENVRDAAKRRGVACVLAAQLNRAVEEHPPFIPSLSHLRDSGSIEQVAYCVMALYRRDYYVANGMLKDDDGESPALDDSIDVVILKQQDGPMGSAHLKFTDGTGRIENWTAQ